ncbi:MAG: alpha/beta fold hydrolase [Acidimicrobiales bacterium]
MGHLRGTQCCRPPVGACRASTPSSDGRDDEGRRMQRVDMTCPVPPVGETTDGSKAALAAIVHDVVQRLGLRDVVLVGHDIGGMITYSYRREFGDVMGAVIMDVVIPGIDPWTGPPPSGSAQGHLGPHTWSGSLHSGGST